MTRLRIPVLTYHAIADADTPIAVSPARFAATMRAMCAAGWRTIGDAELEVALDTGRVPARSFVLHFDDGFASVEAEAAPVLAECRFSATIFVVTDRVGRDNDWPGQPADVPRWPLLDWAALRRLHGAGFRIAPHSCSHAWLPSLEPATLTAELRDSAHRLDTEFGGGADVFAYPYGAVSTAVRTAAQARYRLAYGTTLDLVTDRSDRFDLPRVDAWYLRPRLASQLDSPAARVWLAARRALRGVRRRFAPAGR